MFIFFIRFYNIQYAVVNTIIHDGFDYSSFDNTYPNLLLKTDCLSLLVNTYKLKNKLKQRIFFPSLEALIKCLPISTI